MAVLGSTKVTDLTLLDGVIGNLNPVNTGVYDLGTSSLKWRMLYGNVTGDLTGNADSATKLKNGRTFQIKDADNTNAGNPSSAFDGQNNLIINLPSTIKAALSGNAATATTATKLGTTTVGATNQPIYLNAGAPTAITYTANRLYYPSTTTAFTAGTHYVSDTKIAINSTSIPSQTLYVEGQTKINNTTASSATNQSSQLIISNSNSKNVALELWRNANASWQLANEKGVLYLRNNYTTTTQDTYSQNGLTMDYNTSNASFAGKLSIGQTDRDTNYQLYVNSSVAKSIYLNTSHATASGKWNSIIQGYAPNMAAGSNTSIGGGQAASEYNSGFLQFHYTGSGSTSNYIGFGLNGHDYLFRCYGTGNVSIGADNNNYKLYVNGTSYHNGNDTHAGNINPEATNTRDLGSSTVKWANIYATTFHGALDGNAATATKATGVIDAGDTSRTLTIRYGGDGAAATDWIPMHDSNGNLVPVSSTNLAKKIRDKAFGTWNISITGTAVAANAANLINTTKNAIVKYNDTMGAFTNSGVLIDGSNNLYPNTTDSSLGSTTNSWKNIYITQGDGANTSQGLQYVNTSGTLLSKIMVNSSNNLIIQVPEDKQIVARNSLTASDKGLILTRDQLEFYNVSTLKMSDGNANTKSVSLIFNTTTNALNFVFA